MRILFLSMIALVSCSKDNFKKYVALGELRVLAIVVDRAGKAEANPGEVFTVTPYVSDLGSTGLVTASAVACVDPGVSYGATPTCDGNATAVTLTATNLTAPLTDFAPAISVTIPATILAGRSTIDAYNGVNYLIVYSVTNTLNQTVQSFKRIPVSDPTKTAKNANPAISQVLANSTALGTLAAGAEVELSIVPGTGSAESYNYTSSSGVLTAANETMLSTWFYSDGQLKFYRTTGTDSTTYTAPGEFPTTRSSFIVTVLRDGRGGEAVVKTVIHP